MLLADCRNHWLFNFKEKTMERKSAPHIGQILRGYVKKKRISQSGWARKQGVSPKTVAGYLKHPGMRVDTLFKISQMLNYNFLQDIAAELPADMPPGRTADQSATVAALEQQVKDLQLQVATLEKALGLVGGK
jgi:hypothetical protein